MSRYIPGCDCRLPSDVTAPDEESPDSIYAAAQRRDLVDDCLDAIDPRHAVLLRLRYEDGLTFAAIGLQFGVGRSSVHAMHARAISGMREVLRSHGVVSLSDVL